MLKKLLPLFVAPLISCGCPGKDTPEPTPTPTVTVTAAEPTATAPKPEPKPSIPWKKATDEEVLVLAKAGACLVVSFQSNNAEMQETMERVLANEAVVLVVNERFVALIWDGSPEIREEFFGVAQSKSSLLVVPQDDSEFLLFNGFDDDGNLKASEEAIAKELASGLGSAGFVGCADAKKLVVGD
jgi:hypothetical protein